MLAHLLATLLGFSMIFVWAFFPAWWQLLLFGIGGLLLIYLMLDVLFPLIQLESEGSPEDTRRAGIHFALGAVPAIILLVLIVWGLLRAG